MAGRGRGKSRKGTTRVVPDSVPVSNEVSKIFASQTTAVESVENSQGQRSQREAVKTCEITRYEITPLATPREPVSVDVATTSVRDPSVDKTEIGKRKPLQPLQANGATFPPPNPSNCECEDGRDIVAQRILDAIDREVQVRSEAIKAIAAAQLASITSQLDLLLARLPEHVQNMPLSEYLKSCPRIVAREMNDGTVQLQKASSVAVLLRDSKKNLSHILSMARDNLPEETGPLYFTPAVGSSKTSVSKPHSLASEELSWPEFHAKLQALGHIVGCPPSGGAHFQQPFVEGSKSGSLRGVTPSTTKIARIPREGEALLSLNGSPLGRFTPGPSFDNLRSNRKIVGTRATRSTTKRSLRNL